MSNRNANPAKSRPRSQIAVTGCDAMLAALLKRAARHALNSEKHAGALEIEVLDARAMARLHRDWMGIPGATDVLTFDLRERRKKGTVDGQIAICKTVARQKARKLSHDWRHELALYVIHGCLHLCGYDDLTPAQFRRIHKREDEILAAMGLGQLFHNPKSAIRNSK